MKIKVVRVEMLAMAPSLVRKEWRTDEIEVEVHDSYDIGEWLVAYITDQLFDGEWEAHLNGIRQATVVMVNGRCALYTKPTKQYDVLSNTLVAI